MFQTGDQVVYGIHGVCNIVGQEVRVVERKRIMYFVLEPLDQPGARFFVPSDNSVALAKLRHVISAEKLLELLKSPHIRKNCWILDENKRKLRYRELINGGSREDLLQMIVTLYQHKQQLQMTGRKFHLCDENFLRDAQKLLNGEFSLVLGIQPNEVAKYITDALNT